MLLLPQFSFNFNQTLLLYVGHERIQAVTVFGDMPKFKTYGTLKFLLTQNHGAGNFKTLLLEFLSNLGQTL